jgi:hypothetical protein
VSLILRASNGQHAGFGEGGGVMWYDSGQQMLAKGLVVGGRDHTNEDMGTHYGGDKCRLSSESRITKSKMEKMRLYVRSSHS